MAKLTRQEAALNASAISATRSRAQKSEASKKAAKTRLYYIEQAFRLRAKGPMSFKDAGRMGAAMRWGT